MRILLAALSALACAQAASGAGTVDIRFEKYTLPNGLDVILHEDHRLPLVAVNVWYHVGPANETAGRTGFAHLFEHMMFEGSKHVGSKAHFMYLERAGASDINGTTDFDRTNYYETLPSNQLELALWLESDRMGYLLDGLDAEKLENQRDVVRNERRQSIEGAPYGLVDEEVYHQLYPKSHPYYPDVMGSHADIEAARLDDVRQFSGDYYVPNNASLVIAGDIDPAAARRLVDKYFAPIPAGAPVAPALATTPTITAERRVVVTDQIELPRVYMAWLTAPTLEDGEAEADLAARILGGGPSSRLYKKLVQELQLAQEVSVSNHSQRFGSVLELQATARQGVSIARLEQAIDAELARFRSEGPNAAELERARNKTKTAMLLQVEQLGGLADRLNFYNQFTHDPGYLKRDLARYDAATMASVKGLVASRLLPSARVVVQGVPGSKVIDDPPRTAATTATTATAAAPAGAAQASPAPMAGRMSDAPWRALAPPAGPAPTITLPTPVRFTLANGLTVLLAEQHQLPLVAATVLVDAGMGANPVAKPGLSAFMAQMLGEGTIARTPAQLADEVARLGVMAGSGADWNDTWATYLVQKENADPALGLLAEVIRHPRLATRDIERVRGLRDGELQQADSDPDAISSRVMLTALYGPRSPYGSTGTRATNRTISRSELQRFWRERYAPGRAALILAGDLTVAEARALASAHFGSWRAAAMPAPPAPAPRFLAGAKLLLVDRPGAPQSAVRVAMPGVPRSTPDYVALEVMNRVLGGLFSSRLNMNLREAHGYTYGAFSGAQYGRTTGFFTSGAAIRSDATAPGLQEMLSELERIRTVPPSADELRLAQGSYALSLAGQFETTWSSSSALGELYVFDLPLDYYATLPAQINAITSAQAQAAAQKYLAPAARKIIIVGDRKGVEPPLRALGVGAVDVVE